MRKTDILIATALCAGVLLSGCSQEKQYYKQAGEYAKEGSYEEAASYYEKAISENSQKAEYYIDYGITLIELGNYEEAITQFNKAILSSEDKIVDPDNQITRKNNKNAYRGKGIAYYDNHDYKNAITFFEYALEIDELPDMNSDIRSYLADSYKLNGDYEDAIATYTTMIDKTDSAFAYGKRAESETLMKEYDKALDDYNAAIKRDSSNYDFYFGKYDICVMSGDKQEASKTIEEALSINDESKEAVFNQGKLYYMMKNMDKAKEKLAQSYDAGYEQAGYYLGIIADSEGDNEKAIEYFKAYIETKSGKNSGVTYNQLAVLYNKIGDYETALDYINKGKKLKDISINKSLLYNEVATYEKMGDFDTAYKKAKKYLDEYSDDKNMKREFKFLKTRILKETE